MASIAIAMTVKNEEELLRSNILYHRYLGVKVFYVYFDGTTDDTQDTIADLHCVVCAPSVTGASFLESEERRKASAASALLRDTIEKSERHHTARQVLNAYMAWEKARNDGMEWLISIDADELVLPQMDAITDGQLAAQLESLRSDVEQVRFRPLEVVQRPREYKNVFREAVLFKRNGSTVRRDVYDPFRHKRRTLDFVPTRFYRLGLYRARRFNWWYGHHEGKWAVRIGPAVVPLIHNCVKLDGGSLVTEDRYHVLHYVVYSYDDFIKKYRNFVDRPDTFLSGRPAPYRKRLWRDMVNRSSFSDGALHDYYDKWIAFNDVDIQHLQRGGSAEVQPDIIEVTAVRDVFEKLSDRE